MRIRSLGSLHPSIRLAALAPLLLLITACGPDARAGNVGDGAQLPDRTALDEGWNSLRPGGRTTCPVGDDYRFFVRSAAAERLVFFLFGGGACWNSETCEPDDDAPYVPQMQPSHHPDRQDGIFALDHPDNPFSEYSMVVVPYCTGDVHLGDREATYTLADTADGQDGASRTFTVPHRGQSNVGAALDWVRANFDEPEQIVVTGSSAGGVATPFWADRMARLYPEARVVGLGDAAGGYRSDSMKTVEEERWGLPEVIQRHPGWESFDGPRLGIERLYITAARGTPNLELYQFDQAHDAAQRNYLELAGSEGADLPTLIRENRRDIRAAMDAFRSFTVGGFEHTVMMRSAFYFYESDGHRFRDWVAAIVAGDTVPSVECTTCDRPGWVYSETDLRLVDRMLEMLSDESRWDPEHTGDCPEAADRRSLRCAALAAARDVGGETPGSFPATWDLLYTVTGRMGEDRFRGRPLVRFNNAESTGYTDVRDVLTEVRERVRAELESSPGGS